MTTNQTIDGVPRACDALKCLTESFRHALQRGIQPSFSMGDLEFFIKTFEELRALLDAPAKAEFSIPDCPDCACVQDGQCLCIPSKPAAQPQGEPVEWGAPKTVRQLIRQLETLDQDLRPLSMLRVPASVFEDGKERVRATHLSFSHERVDGQWLAPFKSGGEKVVAFWCRMEQPAPVAVVLPDQKTVSALVTKAARQADLTNGANYYTAAELAAEAVIDEVTRLNHSL